MLATNALTSSHLSVCWAVCKTHIPPDMCDMHAEWKLCLCTVTQFVVWLHAVTFNVSANWLKTM